jgi:hypothetical protein
MQSKLRLAALATAALALAAPAAAQEQQPTEKQPTMGVGVALSRSNVIGDVVLGGGLASELYFPIDVSPTLRIEPQLGFISTSDELGDFSSVSFGVGVLFLRPVGQQGLAYVGPRVAFTSGDSLLGLEDAADGTDFRIAGAVGGEYRFGSVFSIGVEGQLAVLIQGDRELDDGTELDGGTIFQTTGLVFFRAYLF